MKTKVLTLILLASTASAREMQHPVRQEIVEEIKRKTSKWEPMEVADNHFARYAKEEIHSQANSIGEWQDQLGSTLTVQ